jgi:hypothetical protein
LAALNDFEVAAFYEFGWRRTALVGLCSMRLAGSGRGILIHVNNLGGERLLELLAAQPPQVRPFLGDRHAAPLGRFLNRLYDNRYWRFLQKVNNVCAELGGTSPVINTLRRISTVSVPR